MSSVVVKASNVDALSDSELEQRVDLLLAIWRNDTMLSSAINHDHFAYVNIVEMGERVVPLLPAISTRRPPRSPMVWRSLDDCRWHPRTLQTQKSHIATVH